MRLNVFQECRSAGGWQPVKVASTSDPDRIYTIMVNPWGADSENICECQGYYFRGGCKHQKIASDSVCAWREGDLNMIDQSEDERVAMRCPKCGGATKWSMEVLPNA